MDSPYVPYQAYKSKRHSRTSSNPHLIPNVSPPPISRPASTTGRNSPLSTGDIISRSQDIPLEHEKLDLGLPNIMSLKSETEASANEASLAIISLSDGDPDEVARSVSLLPPSPADSMLHTNVEAPQPVTGVSSVLVKENSEADAQSPAIPSTSAASLLVPKPVALPTKFRRIAPGASIKPLLPPSPLRPSVTHVRTSSSSPVSRHFHESQPQRPAERSRVPSMARLDAERPLPTIPSADRFLDTSSSPSAGNNLQSLTRSVSPGANTTLSLISPPMTTPTASARSFPSSLTSTPDIPSPPAVLLPNQTTRFSSTYRPGFQPRGVSWPLTDEFLESRKAKRDVGRIERTKLERRLEKLIHLHFSEAQYKQADSGPLIGNRRTSSFFDLDFSDLKTSELWRGVLQSQAFQGTKGGIRAAEQRITPWEDDASVSQCPLCSSSFHPLTNRKHHCRLCGKIICSLPVKRPQRPVPCSFLFIIDPKNYRIEEVGEGVDYGVRRRRSVLLTGKGKDKEEIMGDDEKFLRGVRLCRECRPILLRKQYQQEIVLVPSFAKLYEVFIGLENEIEESLPHFQELLLSLSHDDQPTKEASAARKRLLEAFARYDALSKQIRKLPCPTGSSQDRVQTAILTRANLFLQKNMFPLQSIPRPSVVNSTTPVDEPVIDPNSNLAFALQPLLEQEALLESFVEEAKVHRKFEDVKTLKANLVEIRAEIDKIIANAHSGMETEGYNTKK